MSKRVGLRHSKADEALKGAPSPATDEEFEEGSKDFPLGSYFSEQWNLGPPSVIPLLHTEDWTLPDPPAFTLQHSEAWSS